MAVCLRHRWGFDNVCDLGTYKDAGRFATTAHWKPFQGQDQCMLPAVRTYERELPQTLRISPGVTPLPESSRSSGSSEKDKP